MCLIHLYSGNRRKYQVFADVKDGLAIHYGIERGGQETFTITHARSGAAIVKGIITIHTAISVRSALLPLCDWSRHHKKIGLPSLWREVRSRLFAFGLDLATDYPKRLPALSPDAFPLLAEVRP